MKKQIQRVTVLNRAREIGYVDNKWAIQHGIWRLGAVVHEMERLGYKFRIRKFLQDKKGRTTKNYAYFIG